jgi:hypothetical protein
MNQTKKRLSIINLAISIGDTETIQLQILKLAPLKSDEKIQEIIRGLQAENYAQTQALITTYIETPTEEIIQRAIQHEILTPEEEEEIIEEFDLFKVKPEEEEEEIEEILDLDTFQSTPKPKKTTHEIDYDSLLNLKGEDVLPNNINIEEKTLPPEDDFFTNTPDEEKYNYTQVIEKDDFFDTASSESKTGMEEKHSEPELDELIWQTTESQSEEETDQTEIDMPIDTLNTITEEKPQEADSSISIEEIQEPVTPVEIPKRKIEPEPSEYEPIPYIDQKLKNMMTQYPPLNIPEKSYASVDAWLMKISNEGYTEKEIEEMIDFIQKLSLEEERKAEAAQLLLVTAATQSKYAQFMLARSLFKGDILEKNLPEAFTLINRLAMDDDYAEAICDLGQLYEYGVGIDKDKKRAEELYKEAMELGINRAKLHYERLQKENKGLFSFFKR